MEPILHLTTEMQQAPVRHLRLIPVAPGVYQQVDRTGLLRPDAEITNGLTVLVEWFGAEGVQNFIDFIDEHGTQELRRRLVNILSVKGGR